MKSSLDRTMILPLILAVVIGIRICECQNEYETCRQPFECGTLRNLGYPFHGWSRPSTCGYPGFDLGCDNGVPLINISSSIIVRLLDYDNQTRTIRVARNDLWTTPCAQILSNVSLDAARFNFYSPANDREIFLLYGCPQNLLPNQFDCGSGGLGLYFTRELNGTGGAGSTCAGARIAVRISETAAAALEATTPTISFRASLQSGFSIQWSAEDDKCDACVQSGGACGSDGGSGSFTCRTPTSPNQNEKKNRIGLILGVPGAVALLLTFGVAYFVVRNRKKKREEELHDLLILDGQEGNYELENRWAKSHHQIKIFSYASILSATANFSSSNKLGQGGFGPVYKGRTAEGQDVAVKLLSRQSGQGLIEFKNELILISELQHVNLVKLLGFCIHKEEKMIIYDYMPNISLDCFLFDPSKREQLDWQKRFNIIEGTAQGLLYLHKYSRLKIIHRDMKPNNILLDENMTPKISDFGLARIFKEDVVEANTNRRVGTYGYMAPEYAMQGIFSVKSDVYSFGVLVLEIVSGRRNSSFHDIEGPLSIVEYAWELWRKDCTLELMDPMLKDSYIIDQLQKCIQIGLLCVENHAVDRPTIEDVVSMLKNETVTLPLPSNPAFITRNSVFQQMEKTQKSSTGTSSNEVRLSANQVTLSDIQGR